MEGSEAIRKAKNVFVNVLEGKAELKELMRAINERFETLVYTRKKNYPMKGKKIGPVKETITVATAVSRISPTGRRAFLRVIDDLRNGREPFEKDVEASMRAFETAAKKLEEGFIVNVR